MAKKEEKLFVTNVRVRQRGTIVILCMLIGMLVISVSCKKEGIVLNKETVLEKQQKFYPPVTDFVIVTDAEKEYMRVNCKPESVEEFKSHVLSYIETAVVRMDAYFVVHIEDGMVRNAVLGKNATASYSVSWRNRLTEYFEIASWHFNNPDVLLDGTCVHADNKEDLKKITDECLANGYDYCVTTERDNDGNITGYTVCIEDGK